MSWFSRNLAIMGVGGVLVSLLPLSTYAASGGTGSFGPSFGGSFPSLSSGATTVGGSANYRVWGKVGAGVFYTGYSVEVVANTSAGYVTASSATKIFGVDGTFFFEEGEGFNAGVRLALISTTTIATVIIGGTLTENEDTGETTVTGGEKTELANSSMEFAPGLRLVYDFRVGRFTVGPELIYFVGLSQTQPSIFQAMASLKFWF